ncbi:hypothetical protein V6N13_118316 [Hibiscus sabdariffa]
MNMVEQGGVEEIDHEVEGFTGRGNVVSKDIVKRGSTETHTVELQARVSRSYDPPFQTLVFPALEIHLFSSSDNPSTIKGDHHSSNT